MPRTSESLSRWQLEMLRLAAADRQYKEIARELGTNVSTVRGLMQRMRKALGVRTIQGAVGAALRNGLIR